MKKRLTSLFMALTLMIGLLGGFVLQGNESSAAIYFAGKYNHTKYGVSLTMNQYSSPEGKKVGNFTLKPSAHVYLKVKGTLKKAGTNKYRCKKSDGTFTFKVYKKKVVVKMNKKALKNYYDYRGTYKLKQHFYS